MRLRWQSVGLMILGTLLVAGAAGYWWWAGRQPEAAVALRAAAAQLTAAPGMSFSVAIDGPVRMRLAVQWRTQPRLMRVTGEVSGQGTPMQVSYWVEGDDLYVRDPGNGLWRVRRGGATLPDVTALFPDTLAAHLRAAAAEARTGGRASSADGAGWVYQLPASGELVLSRPSLAPVHWRSPAGGGSMEWHWFGLTVPPGLSLPASVKRDARPSP